MCMIFLQPTVADCGHVFCSHCIGAWIEQEKNQLFLSRCPTCRAKTESPKKIRGCVPERFYSLLSEEAQTNRAQSLQQRKDENEQWKAQLVARRAEEEQSRLNSPALGGETTTWQATNELLASFERLNRNNESMLCNI